MPEKVGDNSPIVEGGLPEVEGAVINGKMPSGRKVSKGGEIAQEKSISQVFKKSVENDNDLDLLEGAPPPLDAAPDEEEPGAPKKQLNDLDLLPVDENEPGAPPPEIHHEPLVDPVALPLKQEIAKLLDQVEMDQTTNALRENALHEGRNVKEITIQNVQNQALNTYADLFSSPNNRHILMGGQQKFKLLDNEQYHEAAKDNPALSAIHINFERNIASCPKEQFPNYKAILEKIGVNNVILLDKSQAQIFNSLIITKIKMTLEEKKAQNLYRQQRSLQRENLDSKKSDTKKEKEKLKENKPKEKHPALNEHELKELEKRQIAREEAEKAQARERKRRREFIDNLEDKKDIDRETIKHEAKKQKIKEEDIEREGGV
jgi:hypothetical protein